MDGDWFCKIADREIGPLLSQQLRAMAAQGQILPTDSVRRGRTGAWTPASHVKGLFSSASPGVAPASNPPTPAVPPAPTPQTQWDSLLPPETPPPPRIRTSPNKPPPVPQTVPVPQLPPLKEPSLLNSNLLAGGGSLLNEAPASQPRSSGKPVLPSYTSAVLLTQAKRKRQQQQRLIVSLIVVAVGVSFALFVWIIGGSSSSNTAGDAAKQGDASEMKRNIAPAAKTPVSKTPTTHQDATKNPVQASPQLTKEKREVKEIEDPMREPTGKPEADFGIPSEETPETPISTSVPKSS
jgi:hypothetical protein